MSCTFNCTQGRRCSCVHTEDGGATVENGLPISMHERPGMLANRWFWATGIACGVLWTGFAWWLS